MGLVEEAAALMRWWQVRGTGTRIMRLWLPLDVTWNFTLPVRSWANLRRGGEVIWGVSAVERAVSGTERRRLAPGTYEWRVTGDGTSFQVEVPLTYYLPHATVLAAALAVMRWAPWRRRRGG